VEDVLIVDGYNVIGAWPHLKALKAISLEESRLALISMMGEYQAITGMRVYIVFDAYQVPGSMREYNQSRVKVLYSNENETADELIERLVVQFRHKRRSIFVATSDLVEQTVIFGQGAYRVPVRELFYRMEDAKRQIASEVNERHINKTTLDSLLSPEQRFQLEKWRREK
jgi:predicted RNA-binding protein with PIN domain